MHKFLKIKSKSLDIIWSLDSDFFMISYIY